MTTTRQFLVTAPVHPGSLNPSGSLTDVICVGFERVCEADFRQHIEVTLLPYLGADDSALQLAFRRLASLKTHPHVAEMIVSREEALALVAELSKQHPARTAHVDRAALDAVRAIREADKQPGQQVQKNARAQLIITDAICRCVPEVAS